VHAFCFVFGAHRSTAIRSQWSEMIDAADRTNDIVSLGHDSEQDGERTMLVASAVAWASRSRLYEDGLESGWLSAEAA